LPPGWTGKLWALEQGIRQAQTLTRPPDYFLLTDADIEHDSTNLRRLVAKATLEDLDLVSLMVLPVSKFLGTALDPDLRIFLSKLYPFRWVNDRPTNSSSSRGCILIRYEALTRVGGIQVVHVSDDCTLLKLSSLVVNQSSQGQGRIWLGP